MAVLVLDAEYPLCVCVRKCVSDMSLMVVNNDEDG